MTTWTRCFAILLVLCASRSALAKPTQSEGALDLKSHPGWIAGQHSGGVVFGGTARFRYTPLVVGISVQGATQLLGSMGAVSTVGGASIPFDFLRLEVLGELGLNGYTGVGSTLMTGDPGAGATLPYAGARATLAIRVAEDRRGRSVWIGPALHYARDLGSTTRTYSFEEHHGSLWGEDHDEQVTRTVRLGQTRISYLLELGMVLPL